MEDATNAIATRLMKLIKENYIPSGDLVAFDEETTGLNPWKGDRAFCFGFCNRQGEKGYIRWPVDGFTRRVIPEPHTYQMLKEWAEEPSVAKIGHNVKFDVRMLDMIGIKVRGKLHETMFMMHCINNVEPTYQLKPLTKKYLGYPDEDLKELHKATVSARRQAKKLGWKLHEEVEADYWMAPDYLNKKYNVSDAERTMLFYLFLDPVLDEEKVREVYEEEMKLWPVTYRMESRGVRVYPKVMKKYMDENTAVIEGCLKQFKTIAPGVKNFNSNKQLCKFFYQDCKLPVAGYTDNGNPSIATECLLKIEHPLAKKIIEFKTAEKARDTFFGKFYELMVEEQFNGKTIHVIHPNFNQVGPATGRYSCRTPNLQNVADPLASRAPITIPARMSFGPRPGYRWWHFDFKQMELWQFFSPKVANDKAMMKFMLGGGDVPNKMALDMGWGDALKEDKKRGTKQTRVRAKLMLYGTIYGIGPQGLSELNKCSYEQAMDDLDTFKSTYPETDHFMRDMQRAVRRDGFVRGPMGRKFRVQEGREYAITNYIVQGSGAQVIKRSAYLVDKFFRKEELDAHLVLTVHDELAAEIKIGQDNPMVIRKVKNILEDHGQFFGIPKLPVDVERADKYWMNKVEVNI